MTFSQPGSTSITVNSTAYPGVTLTSPAGILNPDTGGGLPPLYNYLQVTATDEAGNSVPTNPPPAMPPNGVFSLFSATQRGAYVETCNPGTLLGPNPVNCTVLADHTNNQIPGDAPNNPLTTCESGSTTPIAYSGYADPSIRADTLPTSSNPYGTNLLMLYSHPQYWTTGTGLGTSHCTTAVVETHLAQSTQISTTPGLSGTDWAAYCGTTCSAVVPIWPTEPFCPTSYAGVSCYDSITGLDKPCTAVSGAYNSTCFSSHEVPNFWIDVGYPSSTHETLLAVHLTYWVGQGAPVNYATISDGCLVVSMAEDNVASLGWPAGTGPQQCPASSRTQMGPTVNNAALLFSDLTSKANLAAGACNSWGQPAIMVSGGYVYLAAECIPPPATMIPCTYCYAYYIFQSPLPATIDATQLSWSSYAGPFGYQNLPGYPIYPFTLLPTAPVNGLTALDWTLSADGETVLAVVTPQYVVDAMPNHNSTPYQYGCLAVTFDLINKAGFQNLIAWVDDMDGTSSDSPLYGTEFEGSNGCTYDPMSNTGIVIVRHLVGNTQNSNYAQYQSWSIMDTGVLP